jgi:hypothetical protein
LRLVDQYWIYPIGCLEDVEINLGNVKIVVDFEVFEIADENDTHLALLGFEWANDNESIINLKRGEKSFKANRSRVIQLIDHVKGEIY